MKIGIVGCGYVFDTYMRTRFAHRELDIVGIYDINITRAAHVSRHYGLRVYESYEQMLADPVVELVLNLTSISAHYQVNEQALAAGKHVYSEKPMTRDLAQAEALCELARANGVQLSGAPCNLFSDSVQTLWKVIRDGGIGKPMLIYAELDDAPVYLMKPETWRSATGAPWPYLSEFEQGCTFEHVGYHLSWMCAFFGPAVSVSAFSSCLVVDKSDTPLDPPNAPDFSVGCIQFANGVAARVTCSIIAPNDYRLRVIGTEGEASTNSYRNFQSPVMLERFSTVSLSARKAMSLRVHPDLGRLFGAGGRKVPLIRHDKSFAVESDGKSKGNPIKRLINAVKRREVYCQDKFIGVDLMSRAIEAGEALPMPTDFLLHVTELTLAISGAGPTGATYTPKTTFGLINPMPETLADTRNYKAWYRPRLFESLLNGAMTRLHRQ